MANGQSRSRSPVQSLGTALRFGPENATSRSWAEPSGPRATAQSPLAHEPLACPQCGKGLQLRLQAIDGVPPDGPGVPLHEAPAVEAPPAPTPITDVTADFEASVREHKRRLLRRALRENGGVMTRAAEAVGLKYTTFVAMAHRLGIAGERSSG